MEPIEQLDLIVMTFMEPADKAGLPQDQAALFYGALIATFRKRLKKNPKLAEELILDIEGALIMASVLWRN